jgi:hypothetical protein
MVVGIRRIPLKNARNYVKKLLGVSKLHGYLVDLMEENITKIVA